MIIRYFLSEWEGNGFLIFAVFLVDYLDLHNFVGMYIICEGCRSMCVGDRQMWGGAHAWSVLSRHTCEKCHALKKQTNKQKPKIANKMIISQIEVCFHCS